MCLKFLLSPCNSSPTPSLIAADQMSTILQKGSFIVRFQTDTCTYYIVLYNTYSHIMPEADTQFLHEQCHRVTWICKWGKGAIPRSEVTAAPASHIPLCEPRERHNSYRRIPKRGMWKLVHWLCCCAGVQGELFPSLLTHPSKIHLLNQHVLVGVYFLF